MPYNNSAIPPPDDVTGQTSLPLTRIKRIIRVDDEVQNCSNNAAFVISIAAEMFIQYLAEQGHDVVKSERKPRRNIQYKDLANAVARIDNLEFLSDVVPRTIPYKQYKEKKSKEAVNAASVEAGQTTLDGKSGAASRPGAALEESDEGDVAEGTVPGRATELDMEIRGPRCNGTPAGRSRYSNPFAESKRDIVMED